MHLTALGPAIEHLKEMGIQMVSGAADETATYIKPNFNYFALLTLPDTTDSQTLENSGRRGLVKLLQ